MSEQSYRDFCLDYESDHHMLPSAFDVWQELQQQLSASQAREAELREKLEAAECRSNEWKTISDEFLRRIKASQGQRPYGYLHREIGRNMPEFHYKENSHEHMLPLFTHPIIPPELAELQRIASNATFDLQSVRKDLFQAQQENNQLRNELTVWVERFKGEEAMNALAQNQIAELRKLLEEAKSKAVPEGWLKHFCTAFYYWWHNAAGTNTQDGYDEWFDKFGKAMLAAASQPKEPKK